MMVKRYVCIEGFNLDDVDGDWIRYDDYAALEARVAELERDAARYRWLRDLPEDHPSECIGNMPGYMWDKMIDEGMEESK